MNERRLTGAAMVLVGCTVLWCVPAGELGAGAKGKPLGENAAPPGSLLVCPTRGTACQVLGPRAVVSPGALLIALPGARGDVELAQGKARLTLAGSYPQDVDLPVLDSAVRLHKPDGVDLDFTLARGRVLLAHSGPKGALKVRARFADQVLHLELSEPGTVVALEAYRHWPVGTPFDPEPKKEQRPVADAFLLLVKGQLSVRLNDGAEHSGLRGRVLHHWNSHRGELGPLAVKELPPWVSADPADKAARAALDRFRQRLVKEGLQRGRTAALNDADGAQRVLAVHVTGALDDRAGLLEALHNARHADVRQAAILSLRHHAARSVEHDVGLYQALRKRKYTPGQAETVMHLLHGFHQVALTRPETYQALIRYLTHDQLPVRELAIGHLHHLVPKGRSIGYDAAASAQARERAQAAWQKLIPRGEVPPPPKPDKGV
ncbi:MAG: hypothetical protein L0Z62_19680 [Gemmataceae bacterium]|nr:hypothetical protein [Gemmataceae bacterium]